MILAIPQNQIYELNISKNDLGDLGLIVIS